MFWCLKSTNTKKIQPSSITHHVHITVFKVSVLYSINTYSFFRTVFPPSHVLWLCSVSMGSLSYQEWHFWSCSNTPLKLDYRFNWLKGMTPQILTSQVERFCVLICKAKEHWGFAGNMRRVPIIFCMVTWCKAIQEQTKTKNVHRVAQKVTHLLPAII